MTTDDERRGGAPTRGYKILEQVELEDGVGLIEVWDGALSETGTVEARNGETAVRKAFKEMRATRGESFQHAALLPIPVNMFRLKPVSTKIKESITVSVG